ncbi:MAG: sulfatase-like hydrolase/transferase, partial [Verrucomicrobia bacterium]|nr:sulfatase-like hydrolase/transferase [Verrucomicrobiota bacterium]
MSRCQLVRMTAAVAACVLVCTAFASASPNVVLIYADDMGWGDVGYHGFDDVLTPNIDRIAESGVQFSQGYVSASVCGPSRAGLLTGVYQQRFGCGENANMAGYPDKMKHPLAGLPASQPVISEMLKERGYYTSHIGKWHMGVDKTLRPLARGFDEYFGFVNGAHDFEGWDGHFGDKRGRWPLWRGDAPLPARDNVYLTDLFSDEAVAFIERAANTEHRTPVSESSQSSTVRVAVRVDRSVNENGDANGPRGEHAPPFFLYLAYNAIHAPWQVPQKYLERTKHLSDSHERNFIAAMILAMDDGIGRVQDALEKAGVADNTIVIFMSDNGSPRGQGLTWKPRGDVDDWQEGPMSCKAGMRGFKGDSYEGGTRVPFCMSWPGKIEPGSKYELPVSNLDIVPTVLAATLVSDRSQSSSALSLPAVAAEREGWVARSRPPVGDRITIAGDESGTREGARLSDTAESEAALNTEHRTLNTEFDGVDLLPYITGVNPARPHQALYWRRDNDYAIRHGDWKLEWNAAGNTRNITLFNLADDPQERNDLAASMPEKAQAMQDMFDAWDSTMPDNAWWGGPINRRRDFAEGGRTVVAEQPYLHAVGKFSPKAPKGRKTGPELKGNTIEKPFAIADEDVVLMDFGKATGHGAVIKVQDSVISHWSNPEDYVRWSIAIPAAGQYLVGGDFAGNAATLRVRVVENQRSTSITTEKTASWGTDTAQSCFAVEPLVFDHAGRYILELKPADPEHWEPVNIHAFGLIKGSEPPALSLLERLQRRSEAADWAEKKTRPEVYWEDKTPILSLGVNPFEKLIGKPALNGGFKMEGHSLWCPSIIKVGDTYHMFASHWVPKDSEKTKLEGWRGGDIVRATSKHLTGP